MEKNKKKQLIVSIIAIVLLIAATVGVTYAFFNYTRTGTANTVSVGRIAFNSSQDGRINLINIFPIDPEEEGIMNDATKVGTVAITVTGDTTYDKGVEYLVSAVNVSNTVGTKTIPISISAVASGTLGTSDEDYFDNRETATNHIYKVLAKDTISNDDQLMVGYIAKGATGINGTITIKAYIDKDKILISDTYPEGEQVIDGVTYYNGTPTTNKTVLTTSEWNSLRTNGVSFKVKVVAQEGTWVTAPPVTITYNANGGTISQASKTIAASSTTYGDLVIPQYNGNYFSGWYTDSVGGTKVASTTSFVNGTSPTTLYAHWVELPNTIESCQGCKYKFSTTRVYYYGVRRTDITGLEFDDDYRNIVDSGKKVFLGVKVDENNKVTTTYTCGIKSEAPNEGTPFCITDNVFRTTSNFLQNLWNNGCEEDSYETVCRGNIKASADDSGYADVEYSGNYRCHVDNDEYAVCYIY